MGSLVQRTWIRDAPVITTTLPSARLACAKSRSSGMGVGISGGSNTKVWMRKPKSPPTPVYVSSGLLGSEAFKGAKGGIQVENRERDNGGPGTGKIVLDSHRNVDSQSFLLCPSSVHVARGVFTPLLARSRDAAVWNAAHCALRYLSDGTGNLHCRLLNICV